MGFKKRRIIDPETIAKRARVTAEMKKRLGSACRQARETRRLTQAAVAERAGVSARFISQIENGEAFPRLPVLVHLLDILGVSADWLLASSQALLQEQHNGA